MVQKKAVSSKHDKRVLVDEVPIESKREMAKFKTENARKSCLGDADVLENDETSKKGFNEQENKNISDCQYTHSQTWRHGVENPNLLKENLIFRINLYKRKSSLTVDPVASTCKKSFDEPQKKNKQTNKQKERKGKNNVMVKKCQLKLKLR